MILIDPPTWPAHGTVFSHLVSDASRAELHTFALRAGVPAGAFDRDHYDVAARWYQPLIKAGAVPVDARELVQRLRSAGLRRTKQAAARDRRQRSERLSQSWSELGIAADHVLAELLSRWGDRSRRYHDQQHLAECLAAVQALWPDRPRTVDLAVWFHDAVYNAEPGADEEASAQLAEQYLSGLIDPTDVSEVARLVRMTSGHDPEPEDQPGLVLTDADLSILAAAPERYADYAAGVRAEYHRVPHKAFLLGRAAVLGDLLTRRRLFRTELGHQWWEDAARSNLRAELALIR